MSIILKATSFQFLAYSLYLTILLWQEQITETNGINGGYRCIHHSIEDIIKSVYMANCPGVEFVSREKWGANPSREINLMIKPVVHVFIHHTAGGECHDLTSCSKIMRGIQKFHMDLNTTTGNGWDDVGYNFVIGGDGRVYVGRGWYRIGAHDYGFNNISLAFSLMGNYMKKAPNAAMLATARKMDACARSQGHVVPDAGLHGHRDGGCTQCPGDVLYGIIKTWPFFKGGPLPGKAKKCWSRPTAKHV